MAIKDLAKGKRGGGGGNYLKLGMYELMVDNFFEKEAPPPKKTTSYILEARVITAEPIEKDESGAWIEPNKVGSTVSFVWNTKHDSAEGNTLEAISMISGCDTNELPEDQLADFLENVLVKNCLRGMRVGCEAFRYEAKESKKILILPKWRTIEGQSDEMIEEGRKMLSTVVPRADRAAEASATKSAPKEEPKAAAAATTATKPAGGAASRFLTKK